MKEQSNPDDLHIRLATVADMDEVMKLAIAASDENSFLKASPARLAAELWPALNQDHGLCGAIGVPGGAIEGVVLLRVGEMWYSDSIVVEERAIFIHPNYRSAKGGRARRLCEFSKKVSDTLEIPLLIGVLSSARTQGKIKMYERQFGPQAGAFFLYRAATGNTPQGAN